MDSGVLPRPARAGGRGECAPAGAVGKASSGHGTRSQLRRGRRLHPAGHGHGRRLRALVHGRERRAATTSCTRSTSPAASAAWIAAARCVISASTSAACGACRSTSSDASRIVVGRGDRRERADLRCDARQPRPAGRHRPAVHQPEGSARTSTSRCRCAQGERYPVIESIASDFDVFLSSLPEMMGRANDAARRASGACSRTRTSKGWRRR